MSGLAGLATLAGAGVNFMTSYINRKNDLYMLKYQNEYNSPKNMMKRLLEAGINPNAAAQSIAGAPGYGNMAPADASSVSSLMPNDLGSALGQSVNNALTADLIKSNIAKNQEDTRGQKIQNDYEETTFETRVQQALNEGIITEAQAKNAKLFAEKYPELLDLQYEQAVAQLDKTREEKKKIEKDIEVSDKQIEQMEANIKKLEQDVRTAKSQEAKNYADAALAKANKELTDKKAENQELRNRNLELSGEEDGWKAQYFAMEEKEGKEAADNWLKTNMDVTAKVVENTSKASAQGVQDVVDETPQGSVKKMYKEQMNKELSDIDKEIAKYRELLPTATYSHTKQMYESEIRGLENQKEKIIRKYRNKMRRVDRGFSAGLSAFGFGANAGG